MPKKYKKTKKPVTKKYQRKKMAIQRMPFVEQKYKETPANPAPLMHLANGVTVMVPDSFEFMEQGDQINQMSGQWIYSKWLTTKMIVDYQPCVTDATPMSFILIQGWIKNNLNPLQEVTPVTPLSTTALQQHVANIVSKAYEDPLGTGDARQIKVIKKINVVSNPRTLVNAAGVQKINRQNKLINLKWNVQRKIRYQRQFTIDEHGAHIHYMQCNTKNWIPFIAFQRAPTDVSPLSAYPQVHYKNRHYFTDS